MESEIFKKVRKMLNLANDAGASEGERDNAMRMAHNLLAKHNLSMSQLEADGKAGGESREHVEFLIRNKGWVAQVANSIALLFFCKVFRTMGTVDGQMKVTYIGRASNIITAQEITKYVVESVRKEGRRFAKGSSADHLSFNKGAAARIHERCLELRASAERESAGVSTGTSLVLASVYKSEMDANADYIRSKLNVNLKTAKVRNDSVRGEAFNAGKQYGDRVSLNRQVGSSNRRLN